MIRGMYIRNGEWVTISGVRQYFKKSIFKSLRLRMMIVLILLGIIPTVIMEAVILKSYEKRAVDVRTADIQNQCTILCNRIGDISSYQSDSSEVIETELVQLSNIYNGRVMLIDREFHIVEDTYDIDTGKTIVSGNVIRCFEGEGTTYYDADNRYIEVTEPIIDSVTEEIAGVMLVSVSTDSIVDSYEILADNAKAVEFITLLVLIVLAFFFAERAVRPFAGITHSIEAFTEGYEDNYLHENIYLETMQLSEAFNKMLGRLKVLDNSRQEFVSNVSHELKTPLTSMKVLADSLLAQEEVPVELYQEFMSDLSEEIEREDKIINDLLSLVKLDKAANTMNIASENINALVEQVLKRIRPIAAQRNIELVFESFRPVTAEVDEVKLSLALTNLVENAVKYNHENGWVHVSLNADHKTFNIEVADSGVGIKPEDIDHIFERFYRVDKSHSREIGGTGLGLAIARSAIVMHRGSVKVFSQPGEGTTFTVRIPLLYAS